MFWMILFAAAIHSGDAAFEPKLAAGPFPSIRGCAAAGALGVNRLNEVYPDKDFRVECARDKEIRRHSLEPLMDLQKLYAVAVGDD
jgi:hypothetical protein